jgi:hypothetical protein
MAYDFTNDARCVSLYRFESGALTTDSKGTNTLTATGTPGTSTADKKEGGACVDLECDSNQMFSRTDANLSADFPLKSGTTNKTITVCCWFKEESQNGASARDLVTRYDTGGNKRTYGLHVVGANVQLFIGQGATTDTNLLFTGLSTGVWYWLCVQYRDSDKYIYARLWDDTAKTMKEIWRTGANNIVLSDTPFGIGGSYTSGSMNTSTGFDGLIDQVAIFKDLISGEDMNQILADGYSGAPAYINYVGYEAAVPTYAEQATIIQAICTRNGWSYTNFGNSAKDNPIVGVIISPAGYEKTVVVGGSIHGLEKVGCQGLIAFLHYLEMNPSRINNKVRYVIVPIQNPDGYINGTRKNDNDTHDDSLEPWPRSVDISRNFPTGFGAGDPDDANSASEYYHGPSALSEPETVRLAAIFADYDPSFYVDVHGQSNYVDYSIPDSTARETATNAALTAGGFDAWAWQLGWIGGEAYNEAYAIYDIESYLVELATYTDIGHEDANRLICWLQTIIGLVADGTTGSIGGPYRVPVTIPAASVSASLNSFPVYIDLSTLPSEFWTNLHDDCGADLHVQNNDGDEIPFDLVYISKVSQKGTLFVKTNLSSSSSTIVWICFGSSVYTRVAPTATNGRNAVWSDYHRVFMFGDSLTDRTGSGETLNFPASINYQFKATAISGDIGCHQGLVFDGTHYYCIDTNKIRKYDLSWNLVTANTSPFTGITGHTVNHISDGCIYDGQLIAFLSDWPANTDYPVIGKYNLSDLSLESWFDYGTNAVDGAGMCYVPEWDKFVTVGYSAVGEHLYVLNNDATMSLNGYIDLETPLPWCQGIEYWRGAFWINQDKTSEAETTHNTTYRVELDGTGITPMAQVTNFDFHEGICGYGDHLYITSSTGNGNGTIFRYDLPTQMGASEGIKFEDSAPDHRAYIPSSRFTQWTIGVGQSVCWRQSYNQNIVGYGKVSEVDNNKRESIQWTMDVDKYQLYNGVDGSIQIDPLTAITAYFKDNFSSQTVGSAPTGWTERWNAASGAITTRKDGVFGMNTIEQVTTDVYRYAASIDALGTANADCEILALCRPDTNDNHYVRLYVRGAGAAGAESCYFAYIQLSGDAIGIHKYTAPTSTAVGSTAKTINTGTWYYMRFRVVGTSLKLKVWAKGTDEPAAWDLEFTDSSVTAAGWIGIGSANTGCEVNYDYIGINVGSSAATVPLPVSDVVATTTGNYVEKFKRLHAVHNGAIERIFYFDGVAHTDAICSVQPDATADALFLGFNDADLNNGTYGYLDFLYLRNSILTAAWITAELLNLKTPASFYTVGAVESDGGLPTEVRQARIDISGNARNLSDTGTVSTGDVLGKIGNGAYFSGSGQQLLTRTTAPDLTGDANFTVAFRVKPHRISNPAADDYWHFKIGTEFEIRVGFKNGQTDAYVIATSPSLTADAGNVIWADAWTTIIVFFNGSGLYVEIDNESAANDDGASTGFTTPATSIEMGISAAVDMTVVIDEVGIWVGANALSPSERATYCNGNYGQRASFAT